MASFLNISNVILCIKKTCQKLGKSNKNSLVNNSVNTELLNAGYLFYNNHGTIEIRHAVLDDIAFESLPDSSQKSLINALKGKELIYKVAPAHEYYLKYSESFLKSLCAVPGLIGLEVSNISFETVKSNLENVVRQQNIYRTYYTNLQGVYIASVEPFDEARHIDISFVNTPHDIKKLNRIATHEAHVLMDAESPVQMSIMMYKIDQNRSYVIIKTSTLASDTVSIALFMNALLTEGVNELKPLSDKRQFQNFCSKYNYWEQTPEYISQSIYWKKYTEKFTLLPTVSHSKRIDENQILDMETLHKIDAFCKTNEVAKSTFFLALSHLLFLDQRVEGSNHLLESFVNQRFKSHSFTFTHGVFLESIFYDIDGKLADLALKNYFDLFAAKRKEIDRNKNRSSMKALSASMNIPQLLVNYNIHDSIAQKTNQLDKVNFENMLFIMALKSTYEISYFDLGNYSYVAASYACKDIAPEKHGMLIEHMLILIDEMLKSVNRPLCEIISLKS